MGTFVPRLSCSERNLQQKLAIAGIGVVWVVERFLFVIGLVKTNMKAKCELSKYKKKKINNQRMHFEGFVSWQAFKNLSCLKHT